MTMIEKSAIENVFQVQVVLSAVLEALLFLLQSMGVFGSQYPKWPLER